MKNHYFRIAVSVRLTHPASLAKVPTNLSGEIARDLVFIGNALPASAGSGFHVKLSLQNLSFTGVFYDGFRSNPGIARSV